MFIGRFSEQTPLPAVYEKGERVDLISDGKVDKVETEYFTLYFMGVLYDLDDDFGQFVVRTYSSKGMDGLRRLSGSFTIIIYHKDGTVHIVRDHHATNAQIYYNNEYYSSSLEKMLELPNVEVKPDHTALSSFLTKGYIASPTTSIEGIKKLGAGRILSLKNNIVSIAVQYDISRIEPPLGDNGENLDDYAQRYEELHHQAIKRRIKKSKNVGILLSGGYDSGCNLAALRDVYDGVINSYSVGFKGDKWTELPLARIMSERFGTSHCEYEIDGSEIIELPKIVAHLGDPFVEGGLMVNYSAMGMIGLEKPDVILGGDGSDQYFGTSGREVAMNYLLHKTGLNYFAKGFYNVISRDCFDKDSTLYRIRFHLDKILNILEGDRFGFPDFKLNKLINVDISSSLNTSKCNMRSFEHLYIQHALESDLEKVINQVIIFKAARMAELFGNKMAFPYMDNELYEFLQYLPVQYKCAGRSASDIARGRSVAKYLLKYCYKSRLPKEITEKKKQGGFAPMPLFFNDPTQRSKLKDFILQSSVCEEFLCRAEVERFLMVYDQEEMSTTSWFWYKQNKAIQYFNLLTLSIWWEHFVKGHRGLSL